MAWHGCIWHCLGPGALAHEHRLAVLRILVEAGPEGLPAGAIAERMRIAPSSLTFHLQQLLHSGLASQRRHGRQIIYAMVPDAVNALVAYLTENCCGQDVACQPACKPQKTARSDRTRTAA